MKPNRFIRVWAQRQAAARYQDLSQNDPMIKSHGSAVPLGSSLPDYLALSATLLVEMLSWQQTGGVCGQTL